MKTDFNRPPRVFRCGKIEITDLGKILLEPWEMITLKTPEGKECDITATSWGYYLAPSLNARLRREGYKVALVVNEAGKYFINAVEKEKTDLFFRYLKEQGSRLLFWLDEGPEARR
ncbi:MAG: hypothetical protein D6679_10950 [Candidatus Hydrogenedentota bacterium]|nr:MAG: hypothetical protein D6679_10950 [Candidatus Hydrogenedentota bacterium]